MSDNNKSVTLHLERKLVHSLMISSFSSVSALLFSHPFEVVKSRMQVLKQKQDIYGSLFGALFKIYKQEGITGLYQGLTPAMWFQFVMNGIRLGTYPVLKRVLNAEPEKKFYYTKNVIASSIAGLIAVFISAPSFTIKVKMQIQALQNRNYKQLGMFQYVKNIYKEQGIQGLWKGTNAQLIRILAGSAPQLVAYEQANDFFNKNLPCLKGKYRQIASSTYSALISTILMHPFDLVVSKISQASQQNNVKPNMIIILTDQIQKEGLLSIYKGFNAACFRNIPYTIFSLVFWEYYSEFAYKYGY